MKRVAKAVDFFFNKLLPKKFLVWAVSTVLIFREVNPPKEYWYVAMMYVGFNAVAKFAQALKETK